MYIKNSMEIEMDNGIMKVVCADIDPKDAETLLTFNTNNRNLKPHKINEYANDMLKGLWKANGDTIVIGDDDVLKNGQHRLLACVKTQKTIKNQLLVYLPAENANCYDIGSTRSVKDMAILSDVDDLNLRNNTIVAMITYCLITRTGCYSASATSCGITKSMIMDEVIKQREVCDFIRNDLGGNRARHIQKQPVLAAVANAFLCGYPYAKLQRFMSVLAKGESLSPVEFGIVKLREKIGAFGNTRSTVQDLYFRTQKCLRNFEKDIIVTKSVAASQEYYKFPKE